MVLAVNVSNSQILLGAYVKGKRQFCASVHTNLAKSADEYAVQLHSILALYGMRSEEISGTILSCVVPSMLACVREALRRLYAGRIYIVGPGLKTGLMIRMDDPSQVGSELVCCAVAALALYPPPCLILSLDTATSITALDEKGALCGGAITAGVRIGLDALCTRTAQLPQIDLAAPAGGVIGAGTTASMQSGAVFGTASMLDGMIDRFTAALKQTPALLATGEVARVILPHCTHTIHYHDHLVLDGLYLLYRKNAKGAMSCEAGRGID